MIPTAKPLAAFKVLDLPKLLATPQCGMVLADLGAVLPMPAWDNRA